MHGGEVEVRKSSTSTTWYNAILLDVNGPNAWVTFEDNVWASREVPLHAVRRRPSADAAGAARFEPVEDEAVEIASSGSKTSPEGWSLGRVKAVRNGFYFIGFKGTTKSQDVIVERKALRPVSTESPLENLRLARRLVDVQEELHEWVHSEDSLGCLSHVRAKCNLLVCACTTPSCDDAASPKVQPSPPKIVLVGESRSVELAEKLLALGHFRYQVEIQLFHARMNVLMARREEHRRQASALRTEVFTVDAPFVGRALGKHGERLRRVCESYKVDVQMQPDSNDGITFTITGASEESVRSAKEELDIVKVSIPVEPEKIGWILGRSRKTIENIAEETKLRFAGLNRKGKALELMGLRSQVDLAKTLISDHCEYLPVYDEMRREKEIVQKSFDSLGRSQSSERKRELAGGGTGAEAPDAAAAAASTSAAARAWLAAAATSYGAVAATPVDTTKAPTTAMTPRGSTATTTPPTPVPAADAPSAPPAADPSADSSGDAIAPSMDLDAVPSAIPAPHEAVMESSVADAMAEATASAVLPDVPPDTTLTTVPAPERTAEPTAESAVEPAVEPVAAPATLPATAPTSAPAPERTTEPTEEAAVEPAAEPATVPAAPPATVPLTAPAPERTTEPMAESAVEPITEPAAVPSAPPAMALTSALAPEHTTEPTAESSVKPTLEPVVAAAMPISVLPSRPSAVASTATPAAAPTAVPTTAPAAAPGVDLAVEPSTEADAEPAVALAAAPITGHTTPPAMVEAAESGQEPPTELGTELSEDSATVVPATATPTTSSAVLSAAPDAGCAASSTGEAKATEVLAEEAATEKADLLAMDTEEAARLATEVAGTEDVNDASARPESAVQQLIQHFQGWRGAASS